MPISVTVTRMASAKSRWSSTIRTRMRTSAPCSRAARSRTRHRARPIRRPIAPPCASTIRRAMNRPRPLPRTAVRHHPASERIEDQVALGRRHPGPTVPHADPGAVFSLFDEDADRRGLRGVRHGVANDIRDRPPELLLVRVHPDLLRCIEDNDTVIGLRGAARDRSPGRSGPGRCDPCRSEVEPADQRSSGPTRSASDPSSSRDLPEELLSGGVLIGDADMIQRGARADERGLELVSRTGDRQIEMLVARLRPVDGADPGERFAQERRGGPNERLVIGSELGHDHERIACFERIGSASPGDRGEARGETIPGGRRSTTSPDVFEASLGASRASLRPSPCAATTDQPVPDGSGSRATIGFATRRKHSCAVLRIAEDGVLGSQELAGEEDHPSHVAQRVVALALVDDTAKDDRGLRDHGLDRVTSVLQRLGRRDDLGHADRRALPPRADRGPARGRPGSAG